MVLSPVLCSAWIESQNTGEITIIAWIENHNTGEITISAWIESHNALMVISPVL
jgi:hypothetical protein